MGYKYEVNVWDGPEGGQFRWLQLYAGESLFAAIRKMWWAKRNGWHCIKLEYRP